MQKILTAAEMREVDRLTTEKFGIPSILLMENAAQAAASIILEKLGGSVKGKSVLVLCGKGNNGGDGAALARILKSNGADVFVYLFGEIAETAADAKTNFEACEKLPMFFEEVRLNDEWAHTTGFELAQFDILIDALWGTGLTRPIRNLFRSVIQVANSREIAEKVMCVSLDIPSGLNADISTQIGENINADFTVSFTAPKLANVLPPASSFNGELIVANIGSPQELVDDCSSQTYVSENSDAKAWLNSTKVKSDSYKKTRGTAMIIAGSENYSGAAVLAANACFAAGAGMVTVAVPKEIHEIVASKTLDEVIVNSIENIELNADVLAVGCGLSSDGNMKPFVRDLVENRKTPLVLDAEALNLLSPFDLHGCDEFPLILTPHLGEFKRLLGREVGEDRIAEVREFSQRYNVILVLKGERSLIAKPDGIVVINPTGNAGVSRAGAGDTLTGIILGFLAQSICAGEVSGDKILLIDKLFSAVVSALYIAGLAGDIAAEKFSERLMTATDVRDCLGEAVKAIEKD